MMFADITEKGLDRQTAGMGQTIHVQTMVPANTSICQCSFPDFVKQTPESWLNTDKQMYQLSATHLKLATCCCLRLDNDSQSLDFRPIHTQVGCQWVYEAPVCPHLIYLQGV